MMSALSPDVVRQGVVEGNALMCEPGPEMRHIESLRIPIDEGELDARLYVPDGISDPAPALVFFHGGGFVICDLETHDGLCRGLAEAGRCKVVSVSYRLAPEHRFPGAVNDARAALGWVQANASALGIKADCIGVGGDSAGANLAAGLGQCLPGIAAQLLVYPLLDFRMEHASHDLCAQGYMLTRDSLEWFRGHYLASEDDWLDPRASPLLAEGRLEGQPPAYFMIAGFDPLRDEGLEYAARLTEAGVPVTLRIFADQIHGFAMMTRVTPAAKAAVEDAGNWLRSVLGQGAGTSDSA